MARKIRSLRHWKQRFNLNATFIWRKSGIYMGQAFKAGDEVPQDLTSKPTKLRNFWESQWIELAEFEEPKDITTGTTLPDETSEQSVPEPTLAYEVPGLSYTAKGNWFIVAMPDGSTQKINGQKNLDLLIQSLKAEGDDTWLPE